MPEQHESVFELEISILEPDLALSSPSMPEQHECVFELEISMLEPDLATSSPSLPELYVMCFLARDKHFGTGIGH
jgi:hypothetical protein